MTSPTNHRKEDEMTINRPAYEKVIAENIAWLDSLNQPHSLERKHIVDVLNWSIDVLYPPNGISQEVAEAEKRLRLEIAGELEATINRRYAYQRTMRRAILEFIDRLRSSEGKDAQ